MPAKKIKIKVKQNETLLWWNINSLEKEAIPINTTVCYRDIWQDVTYNLGIYKEIINKNKRKVSEKHKEIFLELEKIIIKIDSENYLGCSKDEYKKNFNSEKFNDDLLALIAHLEKIQFPLYTRNSYLLAFRNSAVERLTKNREILRKLELRQLKLENKEIQVKNEELESKDKKHEIAISEARDEVKSLKSKNTQLQSSLNVRTALSNFHKELNTGLNEEKKTYKEKIKNLKKTITQLTEQKTQLELDLTIQANLYVGNVSQFTDQIRIYKEQIDTYQDSQSQLDANKAVDSTQAIPAKPQVTLGNIGQSESITFLKKQNEELKQENNKLKSKLDILVAFIKRNFKDSLAKNSKLNTELEAIAGTSKTEPSVFSQFASKLGFFSESTKVKSSQDNKTNAKPKSVAIDSSSSKELKPDNHFIKQ